MATVHTIVNLTRCFDPGQCHCQLEGLRGLRDVSLLTEDPRPDKMIERMIPDLGKENDVDTMGGNDRQELKMHIHPSIVASNGVDCECLQ